MGGWYVAVEPPVPSYSGSGVEGIADAMVFTFFLIAAHCCLKGTKSM